MKLEENTVLVFEINYKKKMNFPQHSNLWEFFTPDPSNHSNHQSLNHFYLLSAKYKSCSMILRISMSSSDVDHIVNIKGWRP